MKSRFIALDILPDGFVEELASLGYEVDCFEELFNDTLAPIIDQYEGIVVSTPIQLDKEMLDRAIKLKYILRPGSGLDNVDVEYAKQKGILVFNSPEGNSDAVGEHALGLMLSMLNNIPRAWDAVQEFEWVREPNKGIEIKGKSVGIIGYGNTGSAFARKLTGLETEILVYDKYKSGFGNSEIKESSLKEIFDKCLVVSFHVPLTSETNEMVNKAFIESFKNPFYLINTSRGKIVNLSDLLEGIENGKVRGAALDVLPNERFNTYSNSERKLLKDLMETGKVIITPHIAGWTEEARRKIFFIVLEKFRENLGI